MIGLTACSRLGVGGVFRAPCRQEEALGRCAAGAHGVAKDGLYQGAAVACGRRPTGAGCRLSSAARDPPTGWSACTGAAPEGSV